MASIGLELARELRRANPFGTFADHQDAATGLDDVPGCCNAFDRLIEGQIERMSRCTGDDEICQPWQRFEGSVFQELHPRGVSLHSVAGEYPGDAAALSE